MATQRLLIASLVGQAATVTRERFSRWRSPTTRADVVAVDRFCEALRANAASLTVLYFSEWIDRWLMGDDLPGPGKVEGRRFQTTCFSSTEALEWAASYCRHQERQWLTARLREAASAGIWLMEPRLVVVVREILGLSATDEEIRQALDSAPSWLSSDRAELRRGG